jgi:hypothetical protein
MVLVTYRVPLSVCSTLRANAFFYLSKPHGIALTFLLLAFLLCFPGSIYSPAIHCLFFTGIAASFMLPCPPLLPHYSLLIHSVIASNAKQSKLIIHF